MGTLDAWNSTFSGNTTGGARGNLALYASGGGGLPMGITLTNCTLARNQTNSVSSPVFESLDPTCGLTQANDLEPEPLIILGALWVNGGLAQTHSISPASQARDAANYATCTAAPVSSVDQRGVSRVSGESSCDIGAYEVGP